MDDMEQKLGSILGNPEMMSQIMAMAQGFSKMQGESKPAESSPQLQKQEPPPAPKSPPMPSGADMAMLQKIYGITQQSSIDRNQQALLKALSPYLSKDRISKLEKAMRAAKIAGFASTALNSQSFPFPTGR